MSAAVDLSFEFFPPRDDKAQAGLTRTFSALQSLQPDYCSVTYGAGGSTRDGTMQTVCDLQERGVPTAAHLSMGVDDEAHIGDMLSAYRASGISRIVALRGDATSGAGPQRTRYAEELVRFIRAHSGDHFHVSVAAYPETHPDASSPDADLAYFRRKVEAGADAAITQYFYNPAAYYDFVERVRSAGVTIPIIPGIMPITNHASLVRFSERAGADIPRWIGKRLEQLADDKAGLKAFGLQVVTELCEELLRNGAPGLHFYTLNRAQATKAIVANLGLRANPDIADRVA
ncbi:MAG: methylenetetrahydrofolate reductase [NAD(P)H] [Pseudomonadota bacterium]